MAIEKDILDQLLAGRDPRGVFEKDGLFDDLKKALAERVLNAELDEHLEQEAGEGRANRRNGSSRKAVLTETSRLDISVPRDRAGTFDPKLIAKYQRRFPGFDEKIVSAQGIPNRRRYFRDRDDRSASRSTGHGLAEISVPVTSTTSPSRIGLAIAKKAATAADRLWRAIAASSSNRS